MLQITDPVHGSIELNSMFARIVNTPEFQRLRSVEQGSFRPVYPGARHDRFTHSLGTYHLATRFAEHFFANLKKDAGVTVAQEEMEKLTLTFRYAALLHDIGHAPFSHTTEDFFLEQTGKALPLVWEELCRAAAGESAGEGKLFSTRKEICGAAHEIVSALLLIRNKDIFLEHRDQDKIDLVLAARMVIGFTYQAGELPGLSSEQLGVRNCLIQLLNCSVLDVDRLDYMGRDTLMSGYTNAPLDLQCLARSVTAVRGADGMLTNGYRNDTLRVFDLMFQAKLSHDAWVLAAPAGAYDAALRAHCIRLLNKRITDPARPRQTYMGTIFSVEALSRGGVDFAGKHYRLLSDVDVEADMKAQSGEPFDELYTRALGERRIAAWRSYYEYHHLFHYPEKGLTPERVSEFFEPLLEYMDKKKLFAFDQDAFDAVCGSVDPETRGSDQAVRAAVFLRGYLDYVQSTRGSEKPIDVVLLGRSNSFTLKLNPAKICIVFPNLENGEMRLPRRSGKYNHSTYEELTEKAHRVNYKAPYFYMMCHGRLRWGELEMFRELLADELNK